MGCVLTPTSTNAVQRVEVGAAYGSAGDASRAISVALCDGGRVADALILKLVSAVTRWSAPALPAASNMGLVTATARGHRLHRASGVAQGRGTGGGQLRRSPATRQLLPQRRPVRGDPRRPSTGRSSARAVRAVRVATGRGIQLIARPRIRAAAPPSLHPQQRGRAPVLDRVSMVSVSVTLPVRAAYHSFGRQE